MDTVLAVNVATVEEFIRMFPFKLANFIGDFVNFLSIFLPWAATTNRPQRVTDSVWRQSFVNMRHWLFLLAVLFFGGKEKTCYKTVNVLRGFPTHFSVRRHRASYGEIESTRVSKSTPHNICCKYTRTGELGRDRQIVFRERTKVVDNVLQHIEFYKLREPSIYLHEIRRNLIADNVYTSKLFPP